MSGQRSILSFFSSSSSELPAPQPRLLPRPAQSAPPPPPPPPSSARFVPPPLARNGGPGHAPPPGMAVRRGGSHEPSLDLAPLAPSDGRRTLAAAGAAEDAAGDLVFASAPNQSSKIVFPRDVHVPGLASVNGILLPVRMNDSFYKTVADATRLASLFNRVILGDDGAVVGGVVCRLEPSPFPSASAEGGADAQHGLAVYIQSLALLSPYRGRGLMAAALDSILATVQALNSTATAPGGPLAATGPILCLYAHVWTEHDDAQQWYAARKFVRFGDAPLADYYFALRPNTAWIVRRDVLPAQAAGAAGVSQLVHQAAQKAKAAAAAAAAAPPRPGTTPATSAAQSYQNSRPETDWNDLPADMMGASPATSAASSRNPSRTVSRLGLADGAAAEGDEAAPPPSARLVPPPPAGSTASSRSSSSAGRKKRERAYPAAMFQ